MGTTHLVESPHWQAQTNNVYSPKHSVQYLSFAVGSDPYPDTGSPAIFPLIPVTLLHKLGTRQVSQWAKTDSSLVGKEDRR